MIKTKAFAFNDSEGINALLSKHGLAKGSHILVSNSEVIFQYEDNEQPTNGNIISLLSEHRNEAIMQRELIVHSNKVITHSRDKCKKGKNFDEFDNLRMQNLHEIERLDLNILYFNQRIEELSK
jgi:hypothetical protein